MTATVRRRTAAALHHRNGSVLKPEVIRTGPNAPTCYGSTSCGSCSHDECVDRPCYGPPRGAGFRPPRMPVCSICAGRFLPPLLGDPIPTTRFANYDECGLVKQSMSIRLYVYTARMQLRRCKLVCTAHIFRSKGTMMRRHHLPYVLSAAERPTVRSDETVLLACGSQKSVPLERDQIFCATGRITDQRASRVTVHLHGRRP